MIFWAFFEGQIPILFLSSNKLQGPLQIFNISKQRENKLAEKIKECVFLLILAANFVGFICNSKKH